MWTNLGDRSFLCSWTSLEQTANIPEMAGLAIQPIYTVIDDVFVKFGQWENSSQLFWLLSMM